MDIFAQIVLRIIIEQENIIGPVAVDLANNVAGLKLDWKKREVSFEADKTQIIEKLIENYQHLFGHASVEVCREAVKLIISEVPKDKIPKQLQ
jgi:hypothetical protein